MVPIRAARLCSEAKQDTYDLDLGIETPGRSVDCAAHVRDKTKDCAGYLPPTHPAQSSLNVPASVWFESTLACSGNTPGILLAIPPPIEPLLSP